jgi:hypothetical protein
VQNGELRNLCFSVNMRSIIQRISPCPRLLVNFRNKLIFLRRGVSPTPNPQAGGPPLVGCPTAYLIYSQLPFISGGRLLHPQPEGAPCRGDKGPPRMIKSRRMRWAGHVARMGETMNAYRVLVGKPETTMKTKT